MLGDLIVIVFLLIVHIMAGAFNSELFTNKKRQQTFTFNSGFGSIKDVLPWLPGWRPLRPTESLKYVDLIIGLPNAKVKLYNTKSRVRFRMNVNKLTDKAEFHLRLNGNTDIAETYLVTPDSVINEGDTWMVRANWGWKGKANAVARDTKTLQQLYKKFLQKPAHGFRVDNIRVIMSKYIEKPLLYNGAKFHARITMFILKYPANIRPSWTDIEPVNGMYMIADKISYIIPAREKYVFGDFDNAAVHDSHHVSGEDILLPEHLNLKCMEAISRTLKPELIHVQQYDDDNSQFAYEILGIDIMFEEDTERPIIIEVNDLPGLQGQDIKNMFQMLFATIYGDAFPNIRQPNLDNYYVL